MSQSAGGWEKEWQFYQDWKGRKQFYGNCLVISLLKPESEHVDTKYIEKIFSFRERKSIAIKKSITVSSIDSKNFFQFSMCEQNPVTSNYPTS